MPTYEVRMRVTHDEVWSVEAKNIEEARDLFTNCDASVETDETGGEVVDWEVSGPIRKVDP